MNAFQWQELWKRGDLAVAGFHRSTAWEWRSVAEERRGPGLSRESVREWQDFLAPFVRGGVALATLEVLARPDALVVVTGQQVGVGLGPLYTLYKALAAKHWAAEIARETGRPCLPVFWAASDDHDLREIENVAWGGADGRRHVYTFPNSPDDYQRSASRVPIPGQAAEMFIADIAASTMETEFRPRVLDTLRRSFADGATYESHFVRLLCEWLLPLGIYPVVPRLDFIRRAAQPIFEREIDASKETNGIVREAGRRLAALGLEPPLHRADGDVNFFLEVDGVRGKVTRKTDGFEVREPAEQRGLLATHTLADMRALLSAEPARFSPNAILRPIVQDAALPTVAYIAGPTELVYHGQIGELYAGRGIFRPAVFPRPNVALLDTKTEKAIAKVGLTATDVLAGEREALLLALDRVASADERSVEFEARIAALISSATHLDAFLRSMTNDTGVLKSMERLRSGIDGGIEKLHERVRSYLLSLDADKVRAREKLIELLFPGGELQERSIGPLSPLLIQYGPGILEPLASAIDYKAAGFQAVSLHGLLS